MPNPRLRRSVAASLAASLAVRPRLAAFATDGIVLAGVAVLAGGHFLYIKGQHFFSGSGDNAKSLNPQPLPGEQFAESKNALRLLRCR